MKQKLYKKVISIVMAMLLIFGIANSFAFASENNPYLLYDEDGITVRFEDQDRIADNRDKYRAIPERSGGPDGKAHLDSIKIYMQSTYGRREPNAHYYRTVGYQISLLDENKLPIVTDGLILSNPLGEPLNEAISLDKTLVVGYLLGLFPAPVTVVEHNVRGLIDTRLFNTNQIRIKENENMWKLIDGVYKGDLWNKPVITSMTISRERLIKELGLQGKEHLLDQAKYLLMAGEVEFYKTNPDKSEGPAYSATNTRVMYNPLMRRLVHYIDVPPLFDQYRSDIESRMQVINLEGTEPDIPVVRDELPDLITEKVDPGVAEAKPGIEYNGKITIRRATESYPSKPIDTVLYVTIANGKIVGSADIPVTLAPGEVKEIAFTWEAGEDKNKDVLIVAEINPAKLNANRIIEKTYDNNIKQATVKMEEDKIDLSVDLSSWTDALFAGETDVFEAIVRNTASKAVTTDIVWRFGGKEVRRASITVPANGYILDRANITMPSSTKENTMVLLEVEVNPTRTKPSNEITYSDNKVTERILCLGIDDDGSGGGGIDPPYLVK